MTTDTPRTDAASFSSRDPLQLLQTSQQLERELNASKAEVAKLNHQLLKTESDLLQSQDINSFLDVEFRIACNRAGKAEAESESRRQSLAFALNEIKKSEAEVERLTKLISLTPNKTNQ
jgi:hypothetical protein